MFTRITGLLSSAALVLTLAGCAPARSVEAFCGTIAEHRDRYLASMSSAGNGDDPLASLLAVLAAVGDLKAMWVELAEVAPEEISADAEAVRDLWIAQEEAAVRQDWVAIVSNALLNAAAVARVEQYVTEQCGAEYAP